MPQVDLSALPFPSIARACFTIALDNDGINRDRSPTQWVKEYASFIARTDVPPESLAAINAWLSTLDDDDLDTVACGEQVAMAEVLASAPAQTSELLDAYFEDDGEEGG